MKHQKIKDLDEREPTMTETSGTALRALCQAHGQDFHQVLERLVRDDEGRAAVLLRDDLAERLAKEWQAADAALSEQQRRERERALAATQHRRLFDEGMLLLQTVDARRTDYTMTLMQIDKTSWDVELEALERRKEAEHAELMEALTAFGDWERRHPEMAVAVREAAGAAKIPVGPSNNQFAPLAELPGYEPPNWQAEGVWSA